jgi:hypothetical protein
MFMRYYRQGQKWPCFFISHTGLQWDGGFGKGYFSVALTVDYT